MYSLATYSLATYSLAKYSLATYSLATLPWPRNPDHVLPGRVPLDQAFEDSSNSGSLNATQLRVALDALGVSAEDGEVCGACHCWLLTY